jgi:DNA-binding NarL/FixJ family response regulator
MRVVIADDHRLVLDGIRRALEADGDFEIVGETQSGTQVLPLVARTKPELVLLDVRFDSAPRDSRDATFGLELLDHLVGHDP